MRIAIVEDRKEDQELLLRGLMNFCERYALKGEVLTFSSGESFISRGNFNFDVVFMDVYMKEMDGLETAKIFREHNARGLIIFTTTSRDFAAAGYRVRAFDYLVKPYSEAELNETLELVRRELSLGTGFIEVRANRVQQKIRVADILYVDYFNHYVSLHLTNGNVPRSNMPFEEMEKILAAYPQFVLCRRNCLVNLDHVVSAQNKCYALENGEQIMFKRGQERELRQTYADYVFRMLE